MKQTKAVNALGYTIEEIVDELQKHVESRSYRVANELRNSALNVLRGQRSGRRYKVPGTYRKQRDKVSGKMRRGRYYTASAPGEPPAMRLGHFRESWKPTARVVFGHYMSRIESNARTDNGRHNLGQILEEGTSRMAPRPYKDLILERTEPTAMRIYSETYDISDHTYGRD